MPMAASTTTTTTTAVNSASILHQLISPEVTAHIAIPGTGADKLGTFSLKQLSPPSKLPPPIQLPRNDSLEELVPVANDVLVNKTLRRMRSYFRAERGQVLAIKPAERVQARAWALVCLILLMAAAPLFLLLAAVTWALGLASDGRKYGQPKRGWAIVTGAHMSKGLQLCRHLNAAGYKVIAVEYPGWWMAAARWSRAVAKFETVPCPNGDEMGYVQGLIELVTKYDVKLVVSSSPPNHAIYDAIVKAALPKGCRSLNIEAAFTAQLDDKWEFSELCQQLELPVPAAHLITSRARLRELNSPAALQGRRFILKSIAYDSFARTANIFLPCSPKRLEELTAGCTFTEDHAWMLQELQSPEEYSSYSVSSHGRLVAHCDTAAEMNNVRFAYLGLQEIHDWVAKFCAATQLDGQVCFDFMRGFDGVLRCTECNPRASAVMASLHNQPGFATALASPDNVKDTVLPKAGAPGQVCMTHEVVHNMPQGKFKDAWVALLTGRDAVLSATDPWPFIMLHLLQVPVQLVRRIKDGRPWSEINWNIGKVLELGGD